MKIKATFFLIPILLFCGNAIAQADLTGTWQGKLATTPNEKLTIQFVFTRQADGSYKVVLNSTDTGGIKNVPASAVQYAGGKLTIDVAGLSGSYSGIVAKGVITGEWRQQGSAFPLVLTPYKKPEAATLKPLLGEWVGTLAPPVGPKLAIVFRFEMAKDGKFAGFMDVPDQNAKGLLLSEVTFEDNQVRWKFAPAGIDYSGKLSGNSINGTFKQGGAEFPLNLAKGKYQAPTFDMPAEDINKLLGQWVGKWKAEEDTIYTVIFRFEKTKDGKLSASTNSPEQGTSFLPLADVSLKGDQLSFRIPAANGEYSGKLNNNSILGTYKYRGKEYEINVTKGAKYEVPTTQADIPDAEMKKLLGRWNGKLGNASVVFRIERNPAGKNLFFIDIPEQNQRNIPVLKASLVNDSLSLKFAGAEYNGKLSGNKIEGELKTQGQSIPLSLTKE